MSDPYPIDPNTDSSIDLATVIEVLADDPKVVGDRSDYHPTRGRVVKETPSGNRWLGDGDQWISLESDVGLSSPLVSTEALVDASDGNGWETLRGLGFDSGDFVPLCTVPVLGASAQTTSTSYVDIGSVSTAAQTSLGLYPSTTTGIRINVSLTNDTADGSTFVRAKSDFITVPGTEVQHTGTEFTQKTGPVATDPPQSPNGGTRVTLQLKASRGTAMVEGNAIAELGVVLP